VAAVAVVLSGPRGTGWVWGLAAVLAAGLTGKLAGRLAARIMLALRRPGPTPAGDDQRPRRLQDALP
jgi:hypothetical protein